MRNALALVLSTATSLGCMESGPETTKHPITGLSPIKADVFTRSADPTSGDVSGEGPCDRGDCPPGAIDIPTALELDGCDDAHADLDWQVISSPSFNLRVLPGTAAHAQLDEIIAVREAAYTTIAGAIGLTSRPVIDVFLSPNRVAAAAHGAGKGVAWPSYLRYDVIYTGAEDSYEVQRYGHELAHVLTGQLPKPRPYPLKVLNEGLAEYLDQSGRDLHDAYAMQLNADRESRRYLSRFEDSDVHGKNYGRAGSLVQALIERYGMPALLAILRDTHLDWSSGCYRHPQVTGCINTGASLVLALDPAIQAHTGETWADFWPHWDAAVRAALAANPGRIDPATLEDVENLVALMDQAINTKDADIYRSTMEGFYCDWGGEQVRTDAAIRTVDSYQDVESRILAIYPTGIKNFATAYALVERTEARGTTSVHGIQLEHVDGTWRQTWGPDWQ